MVVLHRDTLFLRPLHRGMRYTSNYDANRPITRRQVDAFSHVVLVKAVSRHQEEEERPLWSPVGPLMERGVRAKVKTNSLLGWRELWHCEPLLSRPR